MDRERVHKTSSLDEDYFDWLYGLVWSPEVRNPARSYRALAAQLYETRFVWSVRNDDNRAQDGIELRDEYLEEVREYAPYTWKRMDCSVLEMLVALARHTAFQSYGEPDMWMWKFLEHMGLRQYNDAVTDRDRFNDIKEIVERFLDRRYSSDGSGGGIYPLRNAEKDQRKVELWYQMAAYLLEDEALHI